MKSNNCDTWTDVEAESHITKAAGSGSEGELPLKRSKDGVLGRVLGSVLVLFIGSGFRKDASFINIGFVRLDLSSGELKYGNEFDSAPFYNSVINLITELRSDVIVVNNNAPSAVVDVIRRFTESKSPNSSEGEYDSNEEENEDMERCEIEFLPLTTFCQQTAIQNFTSTLDLECCPAKFNGKSPSQTDKELYLASQPNFDTPEILKALNAFVVYLGKACVSMDESALPPVTRLTCLSFDDSMTLDEATLDALGIFRLIQHPVVSGSGRAKEGASLFSLVDRTRTGPGRCLLRRWLARPTQSLRVISDRHDAVEFLSSPSQASFLADLRALLRPIVTLKRTAAAFTQHKACGNDWRDLLGGVAASFALGEAYERAFGPGDAAAAMGEIGVVRRVGCALLDAGISELSAQLGEVVDVEETERRGKGAAALPAVRDGVDETLDMLRDTYAGLGEVLDLLAKVELEAITVPWVTSLNAVYLPQVGFLVAIAVPRLDKRVGNGDDMEVEEDVDDGWVEDIGFEFLFRTHRAAYFKSPGCKEMDARLGDVHGNMVDAEREVLRQLSASVCSASPALVELADACTELDAVASLAIAAIENSWTRPTFTTPSSAHIVNSNCNSIGIDGIDGNDNDGKCVMYSVRNPLLEMSLADGAYVRNTVNLSTNTSRSRGGKVWFLTGPNSSGKSVYLSEIGHVAVLAQCGSFVPAESAVLPIFDCVCCRGRPRESTAGRLSSFASECAQLAAALPTLTSRSLLLMDEFGKGTDVDDGVALLAATIAHVALLTDDNRPRVVVATHYADALPLVEKRLGGSLFGERVTPLCMECIVRAKNGGNGNWGTVRSNGSGGNGRIENYFGIVGNDDDGGGSGNDRDAGEVVFLYRVKEGVSDVSLSLECARAVGLPASVVDRAEQVARALKEGVAVKKLKDDKDVENEAKMRHILKSFATLDTTSARDVDEFIALVKSI